MKAPALGLWALVLCLALAPTAVIAQPCQFEQVTFTDGFVGGHAPAISNAGTRIAFTSQEDLIPGQNADGNVEVFLFEVGLGLTQITASATGSAGFFADISGDGTRIMLAHSADLVPGSNPDGSYEVFAFDVPTSSLVQLTDTTNGFSQLPRTSIDGDEYAFASTATDLIPGGNPDANFETYYFNGSLIQVTNTASGFSVSRSMSDDGNRLVIESDRDLTGGNPDENVEVFYYDFPTDSVVQVTHTTGNTGAGSISPDGMKIAYHAGAVGGANNIFLYDVATATTVQLTTNGGSFSPSLTADGSRIAYRRITSTTSAQIYLYDASTDSSFPITDTTGGVNGSAAINANGTRIAFVSNADVVPGMNPDLNSEVYLATCDFGGPPVTEIPTLSTVGLFMLLLGLGAIGVLQIARSRVSEN